LLNISSLIKAGFIAYSKQKRAFPGEMGFTIGPLPPFAKSGETTKSPSFLKGENNQKFLFF